MPIHLRACSLPWVFTYNDWSVGTEYEYMLKAAVTSAIQVHSCDVQMAPNLAAGLPHQAPHMLLLPKLLYLLGWLQVGRVKPFCMFTGSKDSLIYRWLASKGITMIQVSTKAHRAPLAICPLGGQVWVAATPGGHSVADNLPGLTARAAHAPPPCVLQHTPAWKDALIRESTTGNLTPEDKKVGAGERGLWTWCPLRLCVCC